MRGVFGLLLLGACSFPGSAATDDGLPIDGDETSDTGGDAMADAPAIDAPPAPWLAGYTHRRRIDILAPTGPTLANFALHVQLEGDDDLVQVALESIKFTLDDGTTLTPRDVELFDPDLGNLAAWVRVPELHAGAALYLYYGAASPPPDPTLDTWESSVYSLVMPLAGLGEGPWPSSTSDTDMMTVPNGATNPSGIYTPMGAGQRLMGNDRIELDQAGSERLQLGASSFSFSVFVKSPANLGDWDMPFYKGGSSAGQQGFDMELGRGPWRTCISDGDNQAASSIVCADFITESGPLLGDWHWLTAVVDRGAQKLKAYRDGAFQHEVDITAIGDLDISPRLTISDATYRFNGDVDDLRIYRTALTDAWIATEWANVFDPGSVLRIGAPESP